jgi:hypothetical protein
MIAWIKAIVLVLAVGMSCFMLGFMGGVRSTEARHQIQVDVLDEAIGECYEDMYQACAPEMWPAVLHRYAGWPMPWCEGYPVASVPAHEPPEEYVAAMNDQLMEALACACSGGAQ